jgi:shikimate dehydrogenase
MKINKDTQIYGSFAQKAGNNGCKMFNAAFEYHDLNAIYKSFSINNIEDALVSMRVLNIKGVGITMPYKVEAYEYVDKVDEIAERIQTINTIINNNGVLTGYNTDYFAALEVLTESISLTPQAPLVILGDGGYAKAVKAAAEYLNIKILYNITRKNWNDIEKVKYSIIYNCTPVKDIKYNRTNKFIDCNVETQMGQRLSKIQASVQYKLYTNLEFPIR